MLKVVIGEEFYNETTEEFEMPESVVLNLEHSLISVSKWESEFKKPFLSRGKMTTEEVYGYLKAMVVTPNADLDVLYNCSSETLNQIQQYIDSSESATTFGQMPERQGPGEVITSELIYYWMVTFNIPFECERWHLNRLFALIRICNIKNSKPKALSKHAIAERNRRINEERKAKLGTRG